MRDHLVRTILIGAALASIAIAAPASATAQPLAPNAPQAPAAMPDTAADGRGLQITPFMTLGDDFGAGAGASFVFPLTRRFSLEAEAMGDRDALRTGVSLLMTVKRIGRVSTYVAGGAGVQHAETERYIPGYPFPVFPKKTELTVGIGGGTTVPISSRWSYRADFRWYNPKAEWPRSWRAFNGLTLHLTPRDSR